MLYKSRFIFNDDAGTGAGGDTGGAGEETTTLENPATAAETPQPLLTADELKSFGFDSPEALKTFLTKQKESQTETPEQIAKKENQDKAHFIKFAADNDLMKVDDFNKYESMKSKPDKDLVFENFSTEYKEDNPDADAKDIKDAFDMKYDLENQNPALKKWAEKQISKEAKELRSPIESSFNKAKEGFEDYKTAEIKVPEFNKLLDEIVKEHTPDKLVLFKTKDGEDEISIDVDLTDKERKEITEAFRNVKNYTKFVGSKDKLDDLKASLAKKVTSFLKEKYFDTIAEKSLEIGKGRGVLKGSNIGAEQPFAVIKGGAPTKEERLSGEKEVMDDDVALRQKINSNR